MQQKNRNEADGIRARAYLYKRYEYNAGCILFPFYYGIYIRTLIPRVDFSGAPIYMVCLEKRRLNFVP